MDGMDQEILQEFFTEAEESLDSLEQDLIRLEALSADGDTDADLVDRIFRVLHTLKGGAGFLGLDKLAKLAHCGETLLDEVRGGRVKVTTPVMDALLDSNDTLRTMMDNYMAGDDNSNMDNSELIKKLEDLTCGDANEAPAPQAVNTDLLDEVKNDPQLGAPAEEETPAAAEPAEAEAPVVNADLLDEVKNDPQLGAPAEEEAPAAAEPAPKPPVNAELLDEVMNDPQLGAPAAEEPVLEAEIADEEKEESAPAEAQGTEVAPAQPRDVTPVERRQKGDDRRQANEDDRRKQTSRRKIDAPAETLRIETTRLDEVMNLVGELVLARNSLIRQLSTPDAQKALRTLSNHSAIVNNFEIFGRVTTDLQTSVLRTRMQPISKVFDKIPRQVRTLKSQLGKDIELTIEGEDTEVDKSLVEDLGDPMVHLIRNALDHGIEDPETREANGKARTGSLHISACYEGNNVVIKVIDDGKGIPPDIIKRKAVEKGIINESAAEQMADEDAVRLILAPGFSTADTVSDVSGRGVGMDVVNSNIQKLKGQLDIRSEEGKGTTIRVQLPLTLAIVQALVVEAAEEFFAVPIGDVAEVIKFNPEHRRNVNNNDVIELRNQTLPLFYLHQLAKGGGSIPERGFIIVIRENTQMVGLVVDKLHGQEEAVIKQLSDLFTTHPAVAGATINGDGQVQMILDVPYLLKDLTRRAA